MRSGLLLIALLGAGCAASPPGPEHREPKWTLKFSNAVLPAESAKGMVYVRIEKVEPGLGNVSAKHVQVLGDRIGWWPETPDGEPVSVHPVKLPDGKSKMVDFNTDLRLMTVVPVNKVILVKRCKPIFEIKYGDKIACEVCLENRSFDCHEVTYGNGAEVRRVFVPEPARLNQLCPAHERDPDAQFTSERGLETRALLRQADQLWATNPAAAIQIYRRLLKDHLEYVNLFEVRNKVESRARQS